MQTRNGLYIARDAVSESEFRADHDRLLSIALQIIGENP